jgi:hypothetical protein
MNFKVFGGKRLKYYIGISLEGLRETTITTSQDSRSPCQDLNLESLENEARVLTTQPRRSVCRSELAIGNRDDFLFRRMGVLWFSAAPPSKCQPSL